MGFLKRTNKKFDYQPRYYKGEGNPFKIEHKLDQFRTTAGKNKGLKGQLSDALGDLKNNSETRTTRTFLIIISVLVLIFLYIIDFDLSIFTNN
jgi:hypothetical protein